jgi:lipid II:glycine glycyltransferase (peptidoglycan interpeptide bridge formation enzyme)
LTRCGKPLRVKRIMNVQLQGIPSDRIDGVDNLFQSRFWGLFKAGFGWTPWGFRYSTPYGSGSLLVLTRRIGAGRSMAYAPHGPGLPLPCSEHGPFLEVLARRLESELPNGCVFLRYDLPWQTPYAEEREEREAPYADPRPAPRLRELRMNFGTSEWNLRKAPTDLLPPDTVIVDLKAGDEQLLAGMSSTARYNVRMSERRGVKAQEASSAELPTWYRMYAATARRHGLESHPRSYFQRLFRTPRGDSPWSARIRLLIARVGGAAAAGMVLALSGERAVYLFGASLRRHSRLAPSHRLQWRAMKLAKREGCTSYDLFGIPPSTQAAHPAHGLLRFKTGFGGKILRRRGCWDFPYDRGVYEQLRGAELGRERFHRSVNGDL